MTPKDTPLTRSQRLDDVVRKVNGMLEEDENCFLKASDEDMARFLLDAGLIENEHLERAGHNMWIFACYQTVPFDHFQYHYYLSVFMANPNNE